MTDPEALLSAMPSSVARDVRLALDASVEEARRIAHVSRAWRAPTREVRPVLARVMATALREPTLWLGLELRRFIRDADADLAFGVDHNGLLRCSPEPWSTLVADGDGRRHDADGPVVTVDGLQTLRPSLADPLPWLADPGPVARAPIRLSYFIGSRAPLTVERPTPVAFPGIDLRGEGGGFATVALAQGELGDVEGGRLANLGGGRLGVHDLLSARTCIVDDGIDRGLAAADGSREHARFSRFRLELHGRVIRIVDGKFLR